MGWKPPEDAPEVGEFIARFRSNGREKNVVLERSRTASGRVIGVAAGLFEWDMGKMIGWHPLPEGLSD